MDYGEKQSEIVRIVLSDNNIQCFINVIDKAKEEYQKEVIKREPEIIFVKNWNIPESLSFGSIYIKEDRKKSIMHTFFTDNRWRPEISFIEYLEKSDKVDWWFKNGDRDAIYFAVSYKNDIDKPFYVDFIVKLKNGRIGLFDTKAGFTRIVAGSKIKGLFDYIKNENKKGKDLFGGIVINTDKRNYHGRWIYFDKSSKQLKENDFTNWKDLDF